MHQATMHHCRLLAVVGLIIAVLATVGVVAQATEVRYSGVVFSNIGIDTASISAALGYDRLAERITLIGVEGMASEYSGWVFGGFGAKGKVIEATSTHRTELHVALGGLTAETLLQPQSPTSYIAAARLGAGQYTLHLVQVNKEQQIDSLNDAANIATTTTLTSPVWYAEPSLGMRSQLGDFLVLEARLGYSFSMTSGEWRHGTTNVGTAHVQLGGPSLSIGVKISSF